MAFLAKLFLQGEVRNVLDLEFGYKQYTDGTGRPSTAPQGGLISFSIESTRDDSLLYMWAIDQLMKLQGCIRVYKHDGISKLYDIEFANCYCVFLEEKFSSKGNKSMCIRITISPGIQRTRGIVYEKGWNLSNPFENENVKVLEREEENQEKKLIQYFVTDQTNNELDDYEVGDTIVLNIQTQNRIGDKITIQLQDKTHDFEYQGNVLENDTIEDYVISSDLEKITLKVISQSS